LIIVHGLFGSTQNWRSVGKSLNGRLKRKVILADLRNHGDSPHTDTMTFSTDRAILLGHSLGGLVCTYFALTKPKRVEKFIVEDVAPRSLRPEASAPWNYVSLLKNARWQSKNLGEARKEVNEQLSQKIESTAIRQFLLMNLVEKNGSIVWRLNLDTLEKSKAHLCSFPQEKLLGKKYDGSTLVVRGSSSDYVRDEDSALFDSFFPNWRMETIDGAGHWIHADQPANFIECIAKFIDEP